MSIRFLSDKEMTSMVARALRDFVEVSSEIVESTSFHSFHGFQQLTIGFDAGKERQRGPDEFYREVAIPSAFSFAESIDAERIVCGRLAGADDIVRIMVANDIVSGEQFGRFDLLYRPAT